MFVLMYKHLKQSREQIQSSETRTAERQQRMLDTAAIAFSDSQTLLEQFLNNTIIEVMDTGTFSIYSNALTVSSSPEMSVSDPGGIVY